MSPVRNSGSDRHRSTDQPAEPADTRRPRRRLSRSRRLAAAGIASTVALSAAVVACVPTAANAALPAQKARQADALTDSFGIKVETSPAGNMYDNHSRVMSLLKDLGVRHVRTDFFANNTRQYAYLNQLRNDLGITSLLTMGRPDGRGGTVPQLVSTAATKVPRAVFAFEGTNEWDMVGPSNNWVGPLRAYQKRLYQTVKANPVVRSKPVYGPALGYDTTFDKLGNLSAYMDDGNLHTYPGGMPPSNRLEMKKSRVRAVSGSKPVVSTETGYHNLIPTSNGHRPASEAVAGIYYPRMILEDINHGYGHTFGFELLDSTPSNRFRYHLGLVRGNWSKKPAFNAVANLLKLAADPGPSHPTGSLAYSISNRAAGLQTQLYQKRDGTYLLFMWRDVSIWNPNTYRNISVPTANMKINLGKQSRVSVYRPSSGSGAQATYTTTSVPVSVGGEVVALAIK